MSAPLDVHSGLVKPPPSWFTRGVGRPFSSRIFLVAALAVATAVAPLPRQTVVQAQEPGAGVFAPPDDPTLARARDLAVDDEPPPIEDLPTLTDVHDAAADVLDRLPAEEWDIEALAAALEFDPERAFAFVRDSIAFDPYAGALRGPGGALAARAGNAVDRALLLSALLDAMAVPNRLAMAHLDEATATRLLERAGIEPAAPLPRPGTDVLATLDAASITARATRDFARLRDALGERLLAIPGVDIDAAREAVREHVWVQSAVGPEWRDLDPSLPDSQPGSSLVPAEETAEALPDEAWHTVTLRVTAGTLTGAALEEQVVLEQSLRAADASGHDHFIVFLPWSGRAGAVIASLLSGDASWVPALVTDGVIQTGTPFVVGGRGTDVFGDQTAITELATLRLSVEARAPGGSVWLAERVLLDRLPDGMAPGDSVESAGLAPLAEDEGGPYVLAQVHHVLISTGGASLRDYVLQRGASAEYVGEAVESDLPVEAYDLGTMLWPVAAADRALVVASEAVIVPALEVEGTHRAFVERPRATIASFGRDATDGDLFFATDLLIDGVGLLPRAEEGQTGADVAPGAAARLRLWYGALQTALETEVALRRAAILDPASRQVQAASLDGGGALTVLEPVGERGSPPGAPALLRDALEGGSFVVLGDEPQEARAWWTVDGRTGETRSVLDTGLGGAVPRGWPDPDARVSDTSYTHGKGPRLPPRPPAIRPPPGGYGGGGGAAGPRIPAARPPAAPCGPSDSGGYIATVSCVSMVAVGSWVLLVVGVTGLVVIWYLILTT